MPDEKNECRTKKAFQHAKRLLPHFRAVVKITILLVQFLQLSTIVYNCLGSKLTTLSLGIESTMVLGHTYDILLQVLMLAVLFPVSKHTFVSTSCVYLSITT